MTRHRRSSLSLALLLLAFASLPAVAQRQNPLTYDDPEYVWLDNRDPDSPRPSPNAIVGLQIGSSRVFVAYGRPGARGRAVFGKLVPYESLWRTGANEATTLTTNGDLEIEGHAVPAGTYSLYTIPRKDHWTIILNRNHNVWGQYGYDQDADLVRFEVTPKPTESHEWLTFTFSELDTENAAATLSLAWETTRVELRVREAE